MTPEGLVPALVRRGLIDERAIVDGDLRVLDASRRNLNFKLVSERGPSYLVKQGLGAGRVGTVAHEAETYRLFESLPAFRPIAALLPRCHGFDSEECMLILELVEAPQSLSEYHERRRRFPVAFGRALGKALGTLHAIASAEAVRDSRGEAFPSYSPGILRFHRPSLQALAGYSDATLDLIKIVQQSPELCRCLDELHQCWREEALIHGDLRWDNAYVTPLAADGVKIVDWEMAGLGDPCWDVGTVLSEYLAFWLLSAPLAPEIQPQDFVRLAPFPVRRMQPAMRAFWRAYARRMRLDAGPDGDRCLRSVRYAGARLIHTAYERMQHRSKLTEEAVYLVQLGVNILKRPLDAAADLFGLAILSDAAP